MIPINIDWFSICKALVKQYNLKFDVKHITYCIQMSSKFMYKYFQT